LFERSKAARIPETLRPGLTMSATCGKLPVLSELRMRGRSAMSAGTADASSIFGAGMILTRGLVVLKMNMP
jgi:hypothetical protein